MQNELMIARALTWRYVVALSLVAMLASAAWVSLHLVISAQESTAAVVNISGRQRMLSQRTALFSVLLVNAPPEKRAVFRHQLEEAAELMQRSHLGLTRGDADLGLPSTLSDPVRAMYYTDPDSLDSQVREYLKAVHALLQADERNLTPDNPTLQYIVGVSPSTLVSSLDKMVRQYQLEGEQAISHVQRVETGLWLITLLLLVLEAKFIFKPFTQRIRIVIARLQKATDNLFESRESLRIVTENANDWIWKTDPAGVVTEFASRTGHLVSDKEFVGRNVADLVVPARHGEEDSGMFAAMAARQAYRDLELPIQSAAAGIVWVRASAVPHQARDGAFQGYLGVWTDITRSKQLEAELRVYQDELENLVDIRTRDLAARSAELAESEERFRLISSAAHDAIIIIDMAEGIRYWNPAAEEIFGHTAGEAVGSNLHELLAPPGHAEDIQRGFSQFRQSGQGALLGKTVEVMALRKGGAEFPIELSLSKLLLNGEWHALGIARDISERKAAETRIRQLAYYDTLTDLPNRRLLLDRLEHALTQAKRHQYSLALLFLDLDNFKRINDELGHDVGDELLRAVANRLSACVRSGDTVSRQGGDEFVIILDRIECAQDAAHVAEKIMAALKEPICIDGKSMEISMSIGISLFPSDGTAEIQDLLKHADVAMYAAKQAGRNCYRYFEVPADATAGTAAR